MILGVPFLEPGMANSTARLGGLESLLCRAQQMERVIA